MTAAFSQNSAFSQQAAVQPASGCPDVRPGRWQAVGVDQDRDSLQHRCRMKHVGFGKRSSDCLFVIVSAHPGHLHDSAGNLHDKPQSTPITHQPLLRYQPAGRFDHMQNLHVVWSCVYSGAR